MGIKAQSLVLLCSLSFCGDFSNGMDEDMVAVFFEPVQGFIVIGCQSVKRREGLSARSYLGSFLDGNSKERIMDNLKKILENL